MTYNQPVGMRRPPCGSTWNDPAARLPPGFRGRRLDYIEPVISERPSLCMHLRQGFDLLKRTKDIPGTVSTPALTSYEPDLGENCVLKRPAWSSSHELGRSPIGARASVPQNQSKWEPYYKIQPTLVRSRKTVSKANSQLQSQTNSKANLDSFPNKTKQVLKREETPQEFKEDLQEKGEKPGVHFCLPPKQEMHKKDPVISGKEGGDSVSLTEKKAICDALILQKLLEIRNHISKEEKRLKRPSSTENEPCCRCAEDCSTCPGDCAEITRSCRKAELGNHKVVYIDKGDEKDYVLENALKTARLAPKIPAPKIVDDGYGHCRLVDPTRMVFKKDYGQVPGYLRRRKSELQQIREQEDEDLYDGICRALTTEQRQKLIQKMSESWEQLFVEYQRLPLFVTSNKVIKKKSELESKLRDLETDIRLIGRHGQLFISTTPEDSYFLWN